MRCVRYPSIAFHSGTQSLAVGSRERSCVLFDLRTATKLQVLEVLISVLAILRYGDS